MKYSYKIKFCKYAKGSYLPGILLASVVFIAFASALVGIAIANVKRAAHHEKIVSALDVAEAGINYYMWHLSHDNMDYCDGNVCNGAGPTFGPFVHDYRDFRGDIIGTYSLYITSPLQGEAVVKVKSVGKLKNSRSESTVVADIGMPSFARYSFVTNTECWFGSNEKTNGPVHSNIGVHYDGTGDGIISSSSKTYKPSNSFGGDGQYHDGVWGNGGPVGFWVFPVPPVDFNRVSVDLNNIQIEAQRAGIHLDPSNSLGYYLKLTGSGIEIYKVTKERSTGITTTLISTRGLPSNGIVYVNDNVWVDGTSNGKITIAAEFLHGNQKAKIVIKDNLLYAAKDGSSSIGLVSQGDIIVPSYATTDLEINAALLAQQGHVWFPEANGYIKNNISVYGSIASNLTWTWSWMNGSTLTSGYKTTNQTYDPYLTLSPPPQFPTTGNYTVLNWREE